MSFNPDAPRFLEIVRNTLISYKGVVGDGNTLADVSKIARVEPITIISSSLAGEKELYNILHGVLNIYAAYYLQAVHILSASLADVRILKILDKVNPDRDLKTVLAAGYLAFENTKDNLKTLSLENAKYGLPMLGMKDIVTESILDENEENTLTTSINKLDTFEKLGSAVGKVMEVKFNVQSNEDKRSNPTEVAIPVVVKLDSMVVPSEVTSRILTSTADEITLGSRFRDALAGRIEFIKDFILCSDLIKSQKRTMMKDPTGAYSALLKRLNNSKVYSALTGNISLAGVSSIIVISEEEENIIQKTIGGKLSNEKTRNIVFNNTSSMALVVINKEWERVDIYIRGMNGYSQSSFSSFKNSSQSGSGEQIGEILKTLSLGQSPQF